MGANPYEESPSRFYRNLLTLCAHKRIALSRFSKEIGLSNGITTYWSKGAMPKHDTLEKISDYFGISVKQLTDTDIDSSVGFSEPAPNIRPDMEKMLADKDAKIDRLLSIIESQQETIKGLREDLSKQLSSSFRKTEHMGNAVHNDIIQV